MLQLERQVKKLIWIDHHKTALEMEGVSHIPGLRQVGLGACQLTWMQLYPEVGVPRAVKLLGEYDVWDHSNPDTLPFQYGMRLENTQPRSEVWECLLNGWPEDERRMISEILEVGRNIKEYQDLQDTTHARTLCFETELNGLRLLAANAGPTNSRFFRARWDTTKYDAMCLFQWRPGPGKWLISLYTDKPDIDVSETCKRRGGGGHKGAAGFECDELPIELRGRD